MDRLMIQSFLNFSQSAPDALGIGQEMNLRFGESSVSSLCLRLMRGSGRDGRGAFYFTSTVHTDHPPIPGEGLHSGT
jgi:hypothetical protein